MEADGRAAFWEFFWGTPASPAQGALALWERKAGGRDPLGHEQYFEGARPDPAAHSKARARTAADLKDCDL